MQLSRFAFIGLMFIWPAISSAQTFPVETEWVAVRCGAATPSYDPHDDEPGATAERDVVGEGDFPALYVFSDATHLYFRMRIDDDPMQGNGFAPFGWGVELDTDLNVETYELLILVDGIAEQVAVRRNSVQNSPNDPSDPTEVEILTYATDISARSSIAQGSNIGGDPDYFVDWAVERSVLRAEGVSSDTEFVLFFGTSSNADAINADLACHIGGTPLSLNSITSNPVRLDGVLVVDTDGDGYSDAVEIARGSAPGDPTSVPGCCGSIDGGPSPSGLGLRGGPGGCTIAGNGEASASYVWVLLLLGIFTGFRRRCRKKNLYNHRH